MASHRYGYPGPPFNFLGHFSKTQWDAFQTWQEGAVANLSGIELHYRMRAQQLRKTAGVLEAYYGEQNLAPTFNKQPWAPGPDGYFRYTWRDDHLPMIAMAQIKDDLRDQLQKQDESVFFMNQARYLIEKQEDKAQFASEAPADISDLLNKINGYFTQPEYQAVLVMDTADVYPAGSTQARFRVHQLDEPTQYEMELNSRTASGGQVELKEESE